MIDLNENCIVDWLDNSRQKTIFHNKNETDSLNILSFHYNDDYKCLKNDLAINDYCSMNPGFAKLIMKCKSSIAKEFDQMIKTKKEVEAAIKQSNRQEEKKEQNIV